MKERTYRRVLRSVKRRKDIKIEMTHYTVFPQIWVLRGALNRGRALIRRGALNIKLLGLTVCTCKS